MYVCERRESREPALHEGDTNKGDGKINWRTEKCTSNFMALFTVLGLHFRGLGYLDRGIEK